MKNIILIIISLILNTSFLTGQRIFYVSINSGNNSNNGLSQTTAWRTIEYAESNATLPGDVIALKKGEVWIANSTVQISHSGVAGNPRIYDGGLWGSGTNAIIRSGNNRSGGNWTAVRIAACSYVTFQNITIDCNNTQKNGLVVGGPDDLYGSPDQNNENHIIVQDCSILDCGGGNGEGNDYSISLLVQTWNNNIDAVTVQRCFVDGSSNHGICYYSGRLDIGGTGGTSTNSYIGYNTITNCGRGTNPAGSHIMVTIGIDGAIIEHNKITQGSEGRTNGIDIGSDPNDPGRFPKNVIVRYNDVRMRDRAAVFVQNGHAVTANIYYNLLYSSNLTTNATAWIMYADYSGASINFYNNTIVGGGGGVTFMNDGNAIGMSDFKNNILIHTSTSTNDNPLFVLNTSGSTTHSYNSYYRTVAGESVYAIISGGVGYVFKSSAASWEPTGKIGNPLLVDLAGLDWHLQSGSPAKDAGTNVGLNIDYSGNVVPFNSVPDMGAYEFGSSPPPTTVPIFLGSAINDPNPNQLIMTYSIALANISPDPSAFEVMVNGSRRSVASVSVFNDKVTLTLASKVNPGDFVYVAYNKPISNFIQSPANVPAISLTPQTVLNNCINTNPSVLISSPGNGSTFKAPATITITAIASDNDGTISKVEFYNGGIKLGEKTSSPYTYIWSNVPVGDYSLTAVATDNLNSKTTSSTISIVVNTSTTPANSLPSVRIVSPINGSYFIAPASITITANASDSDGTISKVEFYNGATKLAEVASNPYTYTWKDIKDVGTYFLTAIATDNLNATNSSSQIEVHITTESNNDSIKLFPNPNTGIFSIEIFQTSHNESNMISVFNVNGKKVYETKIYQEEKTKQLNLPFLNPGLYILIISGIDIYYVTNFIKI